jgi:lipoprotein-anchoring transpeptidase ErfK/SrfK
VQTQLQSGTDAGPTVQQLTSALPGLKSLISLNDNVAALVRPLMLTIDQAAAEATPSAGSFRAQYSSLQTSFRNATEAPQLTTVQQQMNALTTSVNAEISGDQCGHSVGSGRVITLNLTLQEAVFYQDGCAVRATPITTGRSQLRTPTGTFHIFYKTSPFQFISPWPKSSPFYYVPSWTSWVMEFAGGGYFIHDAPWEPGWEYGPGSQNSSGASHGCVHIPTSTMQWLYQWTPMGTPVIITN